MKVVSKKTLIDLVERAGATFIQAFAAALTLGSFTDMKAVKLAGIAGGYAIVKFALTRANAFLAQPDQPPPPQV